MKKNIKNSKYAVAFVGRNIKCILKFVSALTIINERQIKCNAYSN